MTLTQQPHPYPGMRKQSAKIIRREIADKHSAIEGTGTFPVAETNALVVRSSEVDDETNENLSGSFSNPSGEQH